MRPPLEISLQILLKLSLLRAVVTSDCPVSSPLGMESGTIQNHQITASSYRGGNIPEKARLNRNGQWLADVNNQSQWLQVDLLKRIVLTGIQTQGWENSNGRVRYVTEFVVLYSDDGTSWTSFPGDSNQPQLFTGNNDADSTKENQFNPPITARYIRINPRDWHDCGGSRVCIAMRIELLGCDLTTTTRPTTASTTSAFTTTSAQPAVSTTSNAPRTTQSKSTAQLLKSTNGWSSPTIQPVPSDSSPTATRASVTMAGALDTTQGDDGTMSMHQDSRLSTEVIAGACVAGVVVIIAITIAVAFIIRRKSYTIQNIEYVWSKLIFNRRSRNGSQKEPTNEEGEGTVDNIIYDSATFSANETGGGVSFGQSDGFVDNNLYAGIGESPTREVQNQTSQKNDQNALYANVNKSQDKDGFVDNDLYAGIGESPTTEVQNQTTQKNDQTPLYANVNNSQDEGFVENDLYASMDTQNRDC
ncbi:uncharacterized protein LOC144917851 [Branchiostoma floridae x Branchiostoma belcheri]